jgi:O-acetyl-ADP-ribose deacetylase (regulator of RNase III)
MPTPLLSVEVGLARLEVVVADITTLAVDATVNAANTTLLVAAESTARSIAPRGASFSKNARRLAIASPGRRKSAAGTGCRRNK